MNKYDVKYTSTSANGVKKISILAESEAKASQIVHNILPNENDLRIISCKLVKTDINALVRTSDNGSPAMLGKTVSINIQHMEFVITAATIEALTVAAQKLCGTNFELDLTQVCDVKLTNAVACKEQRNAA